MVRQAWMTLVLLGATAGMARGEPVYLALGDSSAFGETDRTRNPSNGDRGYVAPFADFLASRYGTRPRVLNLAIDGETTASFLSGAVADRVSDDGLRHNTHYADFAPDYPSQHELYLDLVSQELAAGNTIGAVTIQLGANDLYALAEIPGFLGLPPNEQLALAAARLGEVQSNYAAILGELRTRLPSAELYVMGYFNPYAGASSHPFFGVSVPLVTGLNELIAGLADGFGGTYVDLYTPILDRERTLTLIDTWQTDPINHVHLNDAGYQVAGAALIATAIPEPSSLALLAAGLAWPVVVAGRRRRRRAA